MRVVHENFWVPLFGNALDLHVSEVTETLLTLQGVFLYARLCLTPRHCRKYGTQKYVRSARVVNERSRSDGV